MKVFTKRGFRRIAIGIGFLVGGLLTLNGVLAWHSSQRFQSAIATIRAAGEPASLVDLAPSVIPPENNAAVHLKRIAPELEAFAKQHDSFSNTDLGKAYDQRMENNELPDADQLAAIQSILDAHPTILPALQQAAACEQYASLLEFNLPPNQFVARTVKSINAGGPRSLARFVSWKMAVLQAAGNPDEAIRIGMQMLRLTRLYDHEPLLVSYLVSLAMRSIIFESMNAVVRSHQVSPDMRKELDAELQLQDGLQPLVAALRAERGFGISYVQEQTGSVPAFVRWPMMDFFFLKELDAENRAYEVAKLPLNQILLHWDPVTKETSFPQLEEIKSRLIGAAVSAVFGAKFRQMAQTRCLRVLNALEEFRQRTGKEADNVEQLPLPADTKSDPYSGKPLHLKKTEQGWLVYSVWKNGIDDGGRLDMNDGDWGGDPARIPTCKRSTNGAWCA